LHFKKCYANPVSLVHRKALGLPQSLDSLFKLFSQVKTDIKCSEEAIIDFDTYFIFSSTLLDLTGRLMKMQYLLYNIHVLLNLITLQ
jgi:hypothetical protein